MDTAAAAADMTVKPQAEEGLSLLSLVFILGTVGPYIPQYWTIYKSKSSAGFSKSVCGILLIANIIRIFFYFVQPFELTLLFQSIASVISQYALLQLCVLYQERTFPKQAITWSSLVTQFWNWTDFASYSVFLSALVGVLMVSHIVLGGVPGYADLLGAAALGIESMLGVPQAIQNARARSVRGLSPVLIGSWLLGDTFKGYYFLSSGAPWQFVLCAVVQVCTDCFILYQIFVQYADTRGASGKRKDSSTEDA